MTGAKMAGGPPASKAHRKISWQEVAQHNSAASMWVIADGNVYDITSFLSQHPGGREMLLLAAGRDVTQLLDMYHPFAYPAGPAPRSNENHKPRRVLASYQIGVLEGADEFPAFAPEPVDGFYRTLSRRVGDYFNRTREDDKGVLPGVLRMLPVLLCFILCFGVMNGLLLPTAPWPVRLLAALAFGVAQVLPLLHVMHDASHGAIGHNEGYWKFFGRLALDWMAGSNMMSWHHQHIVGHHVYTNVYEADPDLPHPGGDIRRLVSRQAMAAMYQWQWLYLPIVYGILGMRARVQDITDTMLARTSGMLRVNAYDNFWTRIVLVKVIWALWRIVLPLSMGTVSTREFWTLFFLAEFVSGYWLAFNFQVSHITTDVEWPNGSDKAATVPFTWAENQVKTSLDYGHDSTLQTFLCGALNYQIEHHLFPGVSQYHYPAIAPIVRETCKEYGLPYRYEPDFLHAVGAHWSHLKQMSAAGKEVHVD